ncbi:MAG: hypothetical protein ACK5JM_11910 [Rhodoblastus sp.]
MIFLLGAFSAGLLALLMLPAFWRRALRLTRRRLEILMPLSMDEVVAERDLLRAEFAAERRRLEQRMEAQAGTQAHELAELGRRATEIVGLQNDLGKLRGEYGDLDQRHIVALRDLAEANSERGALILELDDSTGQRDDLRERHRVLSEVHDKICGLAEERRVDILGLETKLDGLMAHIASLDSEIEAHARTSRNEAERAMGLAEERDLLRKDVRSAEQMTQAAQARFEAERDRNALIQDDAQAMRANLDATREAQRQAEQARDEAIGDNEKLRKEVETAKKRLARLRADMKAGERMAADQAGEMRADIARLTGALAAAREAPSDGDAGVAQLREAIVDIGARVASMAGGVETEGAGKAQ